jgi:uncharacterized protein YecT (DUF1311 family)
MERFRNVLDALWRVIVMAVAVFYTVPAMAIDCTKATSAVEKQICADRGLLRADADLGRAYATLLQAAPTADIRAMLINSQHRWLKARDSGLVDNIDEKPLRIKILHDAIAQRTAVLSDRSGAGLIARAIEQRRYFDQFPGGEFAGLQSDCEFLPDDNRQQGFTYSCMGSVSVQHGSVLCSIRHDWATYQGYFYFGVSKVEEKSTWPIAYCDPQNSTGCDIGEDGWQSIGASKPGNFPRLGGAKMDAENSLLFDDYEQGWLKACLASASPGERAAKASVKQ